VAAGPPSGRFTGRRSGVDAAMLGLPADANHLKPNKHLRSQIMSNKLFNHLAHAALAFVCLGATLGETNAGSFTRGCAARDLQILMQIEDREDANAVSKQQVIDAIQTMMHARIVCHQGRVVDALKIYETIAQTFTSDPVLSAPIN